MKNTAKAYVLTAGEIATLREMMAEREASKKLWAAMPSVFAFSSINPPEITGAVHPEPKG
jgi:hypothetical protein